MAQPQKRRGIKRTHNKLWSLGMKYPFFNFNGSRERTKKRSLKRFELQVVQEDPPFVYY
jgi:hypothetical protein